jgi:acid stress-induced BolA-like protein IbaG/YrbA
MEIQRPDSPSEIAAALRRAILDAIPDADVEVSAGGVGHFEVRVRAKIFDGLGRVKQQQIVYQAIAPLMSGNNPPVHAIDRLECLIA